MSLEKIENSLKKCPDLPEIKILGWQLWYGSVRLMFQKLTFIFIFIFVGPFPCKAISKVEWKTSKS